MSCLCRICWTGLNCAPENSLEEQSFMPSVGTDCLQSQGTSRHENIWKHIPLSRARRTEAHLLEVWRDTRDIEKQPVELRYVVFLHHLTLCCKRKHTECGSNTWCVLSALLLIFFSLHIEHEVVRTVFLQHANLHNVKEPANLHAPDHGCDGSYWINP
jgi:hypothetical protein